MQLVECQVSPSVTEWDAMPHMLRQSLGFVRVWKREMENDAQRKAAGDVKAKARR